MDQILDLPSTGRRPLNYAGFWIRFAAYIIDYIVFSIFAWSIMAIFGISAFLNPNNIDWSLLAGVYFVIIVAGVLYYVLMESSVTQGTLGKMAVGIKVGKENGERITPLNALGRLLSKIPSALILYIGFIMAGFDAKKQALHDKIASTYVFYN
jgi:uncharacterized RDD family membrane protein YckC